MLAVAKALGGIGVEVARFNFPYREIGSGRPDAMPVLKKTIAEAAARVRGAKRLIIGGRSLGGRAASMLAADGFECDALCRRDLMEKAVPAFWTMHWLEGADHSFRVLKSSGRTDADVMAEVAAATRTWLATL